MTIDEVKAELPSVKIRVGGKDYIGTVRGRKESFASVYFDAQSAPFMFAWSTVARAITRNTTLLT